jgi:hypothetical protein
MRPPSSRPGPPRRTWRAVRLTFSGLAVASLSIVPSLGCRGDGGGPVGPTPVIAGNWSGSARLGTVDVEATFTQAGESVGGTGHFSSPLASGDFTVTGTLVGTRVDLVLTSTELGATVFRGRFTARDRIEGTFDPSGRYETDLTLDRD